MIPTASIDRIVRVKREEIHTVEARTTITVDGHTVAFAWLDAVLELSRKKRSNDGFIEVAVLGGGDERIGCSTEHRAKGVAAALENVPVSGVDRTFQQRVVACERHAHGVGVRFP